MALSKRTGVCAHCGHRELKHTSGQVRACTVKLPVAWRGNGRNGTPIIGYCKCPGYTAKEQ